MNIDPSKLESAQAYDNGIPHPYDAEYKCDNCGGECAWDEKQCEQCYDEKEKIMVTTTINRVGFIGGSDIAAVCGLSKWKSPLQLWAEKTGKIEPKDLSDNEAVELGVELDDFCAKKFERKTGMKVRRSPKVYKHKDYDFFKCQVDRLIESTDMLLEVKTTSAWMVKDWEGEEIPLDYILQVQWQLGITGRKVGYICVLIGGQKFRYKQIAFDQELFNNLISQALIFWQMVQDEVM